ncbi:MAG: lipoate--protein ligase family protein [Paludibacter sp.]|nr:lipoate--protein ligase family protein [Paludibacter sp.]
MKIIHSNSTSTAFNLAAEEYLFSNVLDDVLFLYVNEPSVIIGSNQVLRNEINIEFCHENNIQIFRRMSGGGAVFHDLGNLNYCFISNKLQGKSSLDADFLFPIIDVLRSMEIPVKIGKRKDLWLPNGFKVSGTASHISKNRVLHHGTLLYDTDLNHLRNALNVNNKDNDVKGVPSIPSPVKNISTFIEEQNLEIYSTKYFFELFIDKFLHFYNLEHVSTFSVNEVYEIELLEEKFKSTTWTYKK